MASQTNLVADNQQLKDGIIHLNETTTPTAINGVAKLYTKSDKKLYLQDIAGAESAVTLGNATPASGSIDNLNVNTEQDLITEVTVTTATRNDSIIIDFTNWLADASIAASGATLTIKVYLDDDNGTLREIGNLQDIITEGISPGSMVQINGIGTFERNFKVTVQSSVAPTGGAASDLVKYHYATYDVE